MARRSNRRNNKQAESPLLEIGVKAMVAGIGLLLASFLMGKSPILSGAAAVLMATAWLALGIGALLLIAHGLTRKKSANETPGSLLTTAGGASNRKRAGADLVDPNHPRQSHWSAAVFSEIEWRRFEAVCEALFAQAGFETRSQSHGADGGVDIWLHSKNATGPVAVVQCKHWQGKAVGVKELREFFGVMASHGLKRGTYATTSTYTAEARNFAKANGISAMDGAALLGLITTQRTPDQQAALLEIAYQGQFWKPTCASCGTKMVERTPGSGGAMFWGCVNYPRCRSRIYKTSRAS